MINRILSRLVRALPWTLRLALTERRIAHEEQSSIKPIGDVISDIRIRWPNAFRDDTHCPIFLFSAGWRSGSTLLQRLVMSDERVMLWGEPYSLCNVVQNQMVSLQAITARYPPDGWFIDSFSHDQNQGFSGEFIATLYPPVESLWNAHRAYFLNLLANPAFERKYSRWGFKEVRLGIDAARYLSWLFPCARFLFLYRNPYAAYVSLRPHVTSWNLYAHWPDAPARTPYRFGNLWKNLAGGFIEAKESVNNLVLSYEELLSNSSSIENLENFLDLQLSREVLTKRVGGTRTKRPLSKAETMLLRMAVNPLAEELGYLGYD